MIVASVVFLLPILFWFYLNYLAAPEAFLRDWPHELLGRSHPFANVRLLPAVAFGLGITPIVLASAVIGVGSDVREAVSRYRRGVLDDPGLSVLTWWLVLFGTFVLLLTPHGDQYYAIVLAPPIALFTARGLTFIGGFLQRFQGYRRETVHLALVVLASTAAGTVVLFELSAEFSIEEGSGTQCAAAASQFVATELLSNATVFVSIGYEAPFKWYVRGRVTIRTGRDVPSVFAQQIEVPVRGSHK